MTFLRFMKVLAARTGQLMNYADVARDADISPNTAKTWISILKTSGIVYLLQPYSTNKTSRLVKMPKLYFLDTGLCCYLTGWPNAETLEAGAMGGALLETYVISEILKSYWHHGHEGLFSFYRDKEKREVDLLIEEGGLIYPVEIKKSASPSLHDLKAINYLRSHSKKIGHGGIVCLAHQRLPLNKENDLIPVWEI